MTYNCHNTYIFGAGVKTEFYQGQGIQIQGDPSYIFMGNIKATLTLALWHANIRVILFVCNYLSLLLIDALSIVYIFVCKSLAPHHPLDRPLALIRGRFLVLLVCFIWWFFIFLPVWCILDQLHIAVWTGKSIGEKSQYHLWIQKISNPWMPAECISLTVPHGEMQ